MDAGASYGLGVSVKVFLSKWSLSATISPKELNGETPYPGLPKYFPEGCQNESDNQDKGSLLGPGVTKVDDSTVGGLDQWGHVDGFVPGQKTWVLSTGKIADAIGTPDQFASTDLGRDGDAALTDLPATRRTTRRPTQ